MKQAIFLAVFFSVLALFPAAARSAHTATLEFRVYRIRADISGDTSLTDNIWEGIEGATLNARQGPFTFFTLANLNIGGVELEADEEGWKWGGAEEPKEDSAIACLASPMVTQNLDEPFEVTVMPSAPVQYFLKRDDGSFELKTANETAGISVSATPERGESGRILLQDLTIRVKTLKEREPIEGVTLPVGLPIYEDDECVTSISVRPSRSYGIQIYLKGEGVFLLRIRAEFGE